MWFVIEQHGARTIASSDAAPVAALRDDPRFAGLQWLPVDADRDQDDIKELSGISIRGDKEAPKSLYIVPWHNAELEQSTSLSSNLDGKDVRAVDRESFRQQLQLQELGKSGWYRLTPDKR